MKFYCMYHRGGLELSLATRHEISMETFKRMYEQFQYHYYGLDDRINSYRFIISDIQKYHDQPTWLLVDISEEIHKTFDVVKEFLMSLKGIKLQFNEIERSLL